MSGRGKDDKAKGQPGRAGQDDDSIPVRRRPKRPARPQQREDAPSTSRRPPPPPQLLPSLQSLPSVSSSSQLQFPQRGDHRDTVSERDALYYRGMRSYLASFRAISSQWETQPDNPNEMLPQPILLGMSREIDKMMLKAARENDVLELKALLREGADVNCYRRDRSTALHMAAEFSQLEVAEVLLDCPDVLVDARDIYDQTPLHLAVQAANRKVVNAIVLAGADINAKNSFLKSPLDVAVFHRKIEVARLLLHHGAEVNAQDCFGTTPLYMAVITKPYPQMARLLFRSGAKADTTTAVGITLLSEAIVKSRTSSHVDAIRMLVRNGADVNRKEHLSGHTPMHYAALFDKFEALKALLKAGGNPEIRNHSNETVLEVAMVHRSRRCVDLLYTAGALMAVAEPMFFSDTQTPRRSGGNMYAFRSSRRSTTLSGELSVPSSRLPPHIRYRNLLDPDNLDEYYY